ncbi:unnamed protein product [Mytilus edulis]|uniref:Uncharacterized protein n=1 Tax=Mytilus edulis TaxID=6550 RepID=A0A8S3UDW3_MYTED|nr:unnamed protein product [Mytilus edulis]
MIMDRTGHRSEKAVRTYKRPADSMLKDVSNILNPSNKQIKLEDPKPLTDTRAILPEQVNIENTENAFNVSKPEGKYRGLPSNSSFQNCVFNFISAQWDKRFLSVHFDDLVGLNNYALEKNVNQTSMSYLNSNGPAYLAVDGDIKTCSRTDAELSPSLQIDLKYQRPVGFVLVHGDLQNALHDITIYVVGEDGLHSYKSKTNTCEQHKGLVKNQAIITDCGRPLNGRYIIIEMKNSVNSLDSLMLCEDAVDTCNIVSAAVDTSSGFFGCGGYQQRGFGCGGYQQRGIGCGGYQQHDMQNNPMLTYTIIIGTDN